MAPVSLPPHRLVAPFVVTAQMAQAYAHACGEAPRPFGPEPQAAPPLALAIGTMVLGVKPTLRALMAHDCLPRPVVHVEEDITWQAPLYTDTAYELHTALVQHDTRPSGAFVRVQVQVVTPRGDATAQTLSTLFLPAHGRKADPEAALPSASAADKGTSLPPWHVAADQPEIYARASHETNPIHLNDEDAQAMGLPGRILHGMCTLAYGARVLTDRAQTAQMTRLVRLKARLARPVRPLDTLTCRLLEQSPDGSYAFDIVQQQRVVVVSRGLAVFQKL